MSAVLERFGIVSAKKFGRPGAPAPIAAIKKAVLRIAPKPCGRALIRIGPDGDGGYLIPDDLKGVVACFSPGTNNRKDFEDRLARDYKIASFMCDYDSDPARFKTPLIEGLQVFERKWLEPKPSEAALTLDDWVAERAPAKGDLILQMDIEGAEYRNLLQVSEKTLARFRIVALEIHGLDLLGTREFLEGAFDPVFARLARQFVCVHAHANNCCGETDFGGGVVVPKVLELTFLRKDRVRKKSKPIALPHPLDVLNIPEKPPLHLRGALLKHADAEASDAAARDGDRRWTEARLKALETRLAAAEPSAALVNALMAHVVGHVNVARGKSATQSSPSPFSTTAGAGGGVDGIKTGRFGFHTGFEANPWWRVDLGAVHGIGAVVLYNRLDDCQDRIRTLTVSVSTDGETWTLVHDHRGHPPFGGVRPYKGRPALLLLLNGRKARYVKLACRERTALHLDEVEVYAAAAAC